jgi:uncharacterized membrane protein YfcA
MEIFLPIAEMSVHWLEILAVGFGVGFLAGMFGIGGGFLLTPLLIFFGIPPAVAVASGTSQITAVTFSGVLTQWKRRAVDFKMGGVMIAGGIAGTLIGVVVFGWLSRLGQMEIAISLSYVVLLGAVGGLMLNESVHVLLADRRRERSATAHAPHNWIHRLPFKMRFRESKLYISAVPPVTLGFVVGFLSAVLGVGGGFLAVPVMIYFFRMPTNVVVGTSLLQILAVTAFSTLFHAVGDFSVDIVLAAILISGGVVGVQYGVRAGGRLRGEQLRFLMALLVLAVAVRLFAGLVVTPADVYSVRVALP